jgi:hypothetical protein
MTEATCTPLTMIAPTAEREQRSDRLGELLESMADLVVAVRWQREQIANDRAGDDPRVAEAIASLTQLQRTLAAVGVETASVHQQLQHVDLL